MDLALIVICDPPIQLDYQSRRGRRGLGLTECTRLDRRRRIAAALLHARRPFHLHRRDQLLSQRRLAHGDRRRRPRLHPQRVGVPREDGQRVGSLDRLW